MEEFGLGILGMRPSDLARIGTLMRMSSEHKKLLHIVYAMFTTAWVSVSTVPLRT